MDVTCKAGTWILADGFMDFDVSTNVIYTQKQPTRTTNLLPHLTDIPFQVGTILVVNNLFNPTKDQIETEGVLLLDANDCSVLAFVQQNTQLFDESHNYKHALKVAYNATKIRNNKHVLYLALLHDVCDHKYPNAISRTTLSQYIQTYLSEYKEIDVMIDEISFSKQKTKAPVNAILEAVRDGDRLEALGHIGIQRCEVFTRSIGGQIPQDVIIHCFDKLLRIVPEGYISSEKGRQLAVKRHNIIVGYVNQWLPQFPELPYSLQPRLEI
jgi:uncharacterized protein